MKKIIFSLAIIFIISCACSAVTSKIVKHKALEDFSDGKTDNTIITSKGTISLSSATEVLAKDFNDTWTINSIVCQKDAVFIGTSPNGKLFKYENGKITCIYPTENPKQAEVNEPNKTAKGEVRSHLSNEHVFKLALDEKGQLLAAVSGEKGKLMRYDGKKFTTIFEPNQSPYIFAIAVEKNGDIFLGTGPKGQIWKLDSKGKNPELIYSCQDKNVLCLAMGKNGILYAGTDTRGLVYKINVEKKTASVLYDSEQNEINDLLFDSSGNLYAAATSYKSIKAQLKADTDQKKPFSIKKHTETESEEPDQESNKELDSDEGEGDSLKTANTPKEDSFESKSVPVEFERGKQSSASHIYKIDPNGFVTEVFNRSAVFFKMLFHKDEILLGTGNKAQLFSVNPKTEIESLVYEDKQASQITDIIKCGNDIIFATANPARLIKLKPTFASTGNFQSELIDAGQPAMWGKLQIEADIPKDTKIMLSARTGNVNDVNDPTFSPWTEPVNISGPTDLSVPLGRYCQYKLILDGKDNSTPVIREVGTAYVIPNLPPKVEEISIDKQESKSDKGIFKIIFRSEDENSDKLLYNIDFRKKGRELWINLAKDLEKPTYTWDSKTVEDGEYEFRITASDKLSNNAQIALTGSKVSDPVIVDNTAPVIAKHELKINDKDKTATLTLTATDELSTIKSMAYTIDSNEKWNNVLPDDQVFDTKTENFTIKADSLKSGQHIIALKISDAEDNTMYKTFEFEIK